MPLSEEFKTQSAADWAKYRRWQKVASSNVMAIHYDIEDKLLSVQFKGKAKNIKFPIYKYHNVPAKVAESMYLSGSKGKFVWQMLRDRYDTTGPF